MATRWQIKMIHTLKGALALDDAAYRDMLSQYGVSSSADPAFSVDSARDLIRALESAAVSSGRWERRRLDLCSGPDRVTAGQKGLIRALWSQVSRVPPDAQAAALNRFIERQFHVSVLDWLPAPKAGRVIYVLRLMIAQSHAKQEDPHAGTSCARSAMP